MNNIPSKYNPKEFEEKIYDTWVKEDCFKAEVNYDKKPFTIVMPPPNITGQLHMGHALDMTLQDVLTRWKRMEGYEALWLPGSDHASIATEVKVVEKIRKEEGKSKEDIGREEFLKRAWKWKEEYGGRIVEQVKKLGNSCDWSRERFTMDEGCNEAVKEFFVNLYNKGLIYKGNRIINWCPDCHTTLSDAEVEHEDTPGNYYYVKYPYADNQDEYFVVATTRPETMFGDVAIAAHPDDDRYKDLIGKKVIVPLVGREIPIIADEYPDIAKGTGALKITPCHDPNDFEIGLRHDLEQINCMNEDGTMNAEAGKYNGMDRYECRKAFVKDLEESGFMLKIEKTDHNVGTCYRCHNIIEPRVSDQWFVSMKKLAEPALKASEEKNVEFVPERFTKIYTHWLENIRDWCISRQLWWGHRIPAYYCQECGEVMVSKEAPDKCSKCGSTNIKQDEDVLDTWFSSGLWPFSTLGWPNNTEDLKYFYPTDVLVTGYDIIFFWVVRMVFSALEATGESPFKHVFIHGLVRDAEGRKMSKSLGNGIDPLEVIDQFGADALRFMLMTGISPGNDTRFNNDKLESSRNFANKLWNASRFVLMNIEGDLISKEEAEKNYRMEDKWIISRANKAAKEVKENLDKFELGLAAQRVYDFIWNEYCDWYIEIVKPRLYGDEGSDKDTARFVLIKVLKDMLKLLHPFMPFITEEIWSYLPDTNTRLVKSEWPLYKEEENFEEAEAAMEFIMEAVRSIRNTRAEMNVAPSRKARAIFVPNKDRAGEFIQLGSQHFATLANITEIKIVDDKSLIEEDTASSVIDGTEIYLPLSDLIDYEKEIERLEKEKSKLEGELKRVYNKLSNDKFISKAPENVVNEEKEKQTKYQSMMEKVVERLEQLKNK
ncbi:MULTISPECIES: valine--tRNA ligase [unclassified Sedimentibacter]|uniref:valine--tRNA ligase n=1 Tax=unclassified Sedimentibacter TaxID=2649220 RepID=UPI0027DEBEF3|nr:valine--tRNA ligase [Sedimentibacter sp. MB35-C1]WMJ78370.1 valine--tRNA ligase [Sedimentibacter sp. MB35-C1]